MNIIEEVRSYVEILANNIKIDTNESTQVVKHNCFTVN